MNASFSQELRALATTFADRPARLSEILEATEGRGFDLLLIILMLPFLTPIPVPGLSSPVGCVAVLVGARLAVGRKPWLPRWLLARKLPPRFLSKLLQAASRILRWLEFVVRPRLAFLDEMAVFRRAAGVLILLSGLLLLLPLPIPFTNTLPALTIFLLAAGALERDGLFFLGGCAMFAVTLLFFTLLTFGGAHVLDDIGHALTGS